VDLRADADVMEKRIISNPGRLYRSLKRVTKPTEPPQLLELEESLFLPLGTTLCQSGCLRKLVVLKVISSVQLSIQQQNSKSARRTNKYRIDFVYMPLRAVNKIQH
jgi:hypothetical protein